MSSNTTKTEVTTRKTIVRKYPSGIYIWAYPGMGQFDSYNFRYVESFFKTRNVEFEIEIVTNDKPIK